MDTLEQKNYLYDIGKSRLYCPITIDGAVGVVPCNRKGYACKSCPTGTSDTLERYMLFNGGINYEHKIQN